MKETGDRRPIRAPQLPRVSILLMILFQVAGSVALVVQWPPGPAHLDWGVWIVVYGGYLFVVGAALFYVKTGK